MDHWQWSSIGSDNGLAPTRRQAVTWRNDGPWNTDAYMPNPTSMSALDCSNPSLGIYLDDDSTWLQQFRLWIFTMIQLDCSKFDVWIFTMIQLDCSNSHPESFRWFNLIVTILVSGSWRIFNLVAFFLASKSWQRFNYCSYLRLWIFTVIQLDCVKSSSWIFTIEAIRASDSWQWFTLIAAILENPHGQSQQKVSFVTISVMILSAYHIPILHVLL